MRRYRFALRPRWLLLAGLIGLLVVVMVNLGFWQLRRLHERRDSNAQVEERSTEAPVPVASVAVPAVSGDALDALRYRRVTATGTYDAAATTLVTGRTNNAAPGAWVVTPMDVGSETVLVLRGFVGLQPDGTTPAPAPPTGTVTVTGYTLAISGFDAVARKDLGTARDAAGGSPPVVVQMIRSDPADDASLTVIPLPALDDGPHLSYAVQWFLFSAIALVGYVVVIRRTAQRLEREERADVGA